MAYVGLVPSEHSTGDSVRRRGITKAENRQARRGLIEASARRTAVTVMERTTPASPYRIAAGTSGPHEGDDCCIQQ